MSFTPISPKPLGLRVYSAFSRAAGPLAEFALQRRLKAGKEDPDRISERRGVAGIARPEGELFWIHGASVGESLSVLPLVKRLAEMRPQVTFLVTTGTVTSARMMAERLPEGAIHQFIPLDHPDFVDAFLKYWRPNAAFFVESEFWPNLILKARETISLMALINGRVSPKSFEDWSRRRDFIRYVLNAFDLIIAQDRENADRLRQLSAHDVFSFGNLKNAAPPLPVNDQDLAQMRAAIDGRMVWLAASTHRGEDDAIIAAHKNLVDSDNRVLTFVAPRHPDRGAELRALATANGVRTGLRSAGDEVTPETELYIADTLGELGLFYRLSDISFVGGSLTPKGGHNPLEPARLGGSILHGPYTFNFVETYAEMRAGGGAALVRNERELASAVRRLFRDEKTRHAMAAAAQSSAESSAERVLSEVTQLLLNRFEQARSAV
ncbi:MAG: 3-deoxy-D-manno-octulosonic acid transferase [Pseudomonadota bacterium]